MSSSVALSSPLARDLSDFHHRRLGSQRIRFNGSRCGMLRRNFVSQGVALSVFCSSLSANPVRVETSKKHYTECAWSYTYLCRVVPLAINRSERVYLPKGMDRLPFKPEGYNFWTWKGHKIHYVEQGTGPPVVLIHGFGASAFHWRYNIPELARNYKVYAVDLLGFGWSEKALIEYDASIWMEQVSDFLREIVKEPAILVGNSLGGFTALLTATKLPQQIRGVVLLNSAGQFGNPNRKPDSNAEESAIKKLIVNPLKEVFQRVVLGFLFWQAKQPTRIEKVLKSVYIDPSNVDDYLVESITKPAGDPNAGEVYYRLMTRFMSNQTKYTLDSTLSQLSCPLLLLWGDLDPWVGPAKAAKIKEFYPNTTVVNLQAGHCPHDEVPELVNRALLEWLSSLELEPSFQAV